MKRQYLRTAVLFLTLSIGLLLLLCVIWNDCRETGSFWCADGDQAFVQEASRVMTEYYETEYERGVYEAGFRKKDYYGTYREDHGPSVDFELWQTGDALGYMYTCLVGFDTADYPFSRNTQWSRWKQEDGAWIHIGNSIPAPWIEKTLAGGFSLELPRPELTVSGSDEGVRAEMEELLAQLIVTEYSLYAYDTPLLVYANTDRLYAAIMLTTELDEEMLLHYGGFSAHDRVLRVQMERGPQGLAVTEHRKYGSAGTGRRETAFYRELLECGTGPFLIRPGLDEGKARIRAALLEDAPFICAETGKVLTLSQMGKMITTDQRLQTKVKPLRFAYLQLDPVISMGAFINRYQGIPEAVVELVMGSDTWGSLILRWDDGQVWGNVMPYRGFNGLKDDGTFFFSSEAMDSGFGALSFLDNKAGITPLLYSESTHAEDGAISVRYWMAGIEWKPTESEFQDSMAWQSEKSDVQWYELTPDGVEAAFANAPKNPPRY